MTATAEPPTAPALQLPARYQLRAILKETPATCVYRVFDVANQHDEAIKILRHELSEPQQLLRFKTEFSTLASLEHESIVKVLEYGLLHDRFPYFTMEYFAGKKISEYFDGHSWPALYDVILQIASALHHIHHLGIIHLDLKPSNILVDERGHAKIMDFGVAVESRQVLDRQIRGSLHYMPPEVLKQDRVDSRADLYALGMTLYETVTGALPGYGKPSIEVIRMHLDEDVRPPSSINPRVPPELEQIIMKLLEKDPRHRYPSAAALLDDVAAAAGKRADAGEMLVGRGELFAAPLIGRKAEVAQLASLIDEAREGRGNGVIVAGAEGMGKSRIVRDATLRAQLEGARVFCGRCPINRKTIYAPFFEIFEQMLMAVNPDADVSAEIRWLLRPLVLAAKGEDAAPAAGQKYRLFNRIVQAMQDMYGFLSASSPEGEAGASPLILVIDDVQWADPSTADLFSFLIGEARQNRLLVIGTLTIDSSTEAATEPAAHLAAWELRAREGNFPIIRVEALSEPLVREHLQSLLGEDDVSDDLVRWTLWESAGSPLIIRRVVDYLIAHGYLHWEANGWVAEMDRIQGLRIPGGAASILMERVEALPPKHREVIEAAAVVGESSTIDLLTSVASPSQEEAYNALREVVALGLLDESNDGKIITFPQIHLREAIYNGMTERRRTELHQRVADALEPALLGGAAHLLGQVAFHYARATDKSKGVRYAVEAGDMAMRTIAHQGATDFYRSALELMDLAGADEPHKAEVREKLADAYYRSSDYRSAIQAYQFLLKSIQARSGDDAPSGDLARVMKKIGKVLGKRGDQEAALLYFQNAIEHFEKLGMKTDVAELLNRIAWLHREKADPEAARASAARALQLLDPNEPNIVFGYVMNMLGCIEFGLG